MNKKDDNLLEEKHKKVAENARKRYEELRGCEYATIGGCPVYGGSLKVPMDRRSVFYDAFPCMDKKKCYDCDFHDIAKYMIRHVKKKREWNEEHKRRKELMDSGKGFYTEDGGFVEEI